MSAAPGQDEALEALRSMINAFHEQRRLRSEILQVRARFEHNRRIVEAYAARPKVPA